MAKSDDLKKFENLTFEDFRRMAKDKSLSRYEKVGFPNAYREGKEELIFRDIASKLKNLGKQSQIVVDIGVGCSDLAYMLIDLCSTHRHRLLLIDSEEMLDQLPERSFITKVAGCYPSECGHLFEEYAGRVDAILTYSVFHYIFSDSNLFQFIDRSLSLLAPEGEWLMGDIPNISKRKRFFRSEKGIQFHREFTGTDETPGVQFSNLETGKIDDAVITSVILRSRSAGFDAYWLPQPDDLPMANRREDLLIKRP